MPSMIATGSKTASIHDGWTRRARNRALLALWTVSILALAIAFGMGTSAADVEPDLARLLRYMAMLKGAFAVVAFGACWWRLARPAASWRQAIYLGGPGLMAGGALALWQLQALVPASIGLHAGMLSLLVAALTDPDFIPALRRRPV